jgi:hypothetical protein
MFYQINLTKSGKLNSVRQKESLSYLKMKILMEMMRTKKMRKRMRIQGTRQI